MNGGKLFRIVMQKCITIRSARIIVTLFNCLCLTICWQCEQLASTAALRTVLQLSMVLEYSLKLLVVFALRSEVSKASSVRRVLAVLHVYAK